MKLRKENISLSNSPSLDYKQLLINKTKIQKIENEIRVFEKEFDTIQKRIEERKGE